MTAANRVDGNEGKLGVLLVALTYKRPDDLRSLIPALAAQANSVERPVRIVIVDNDPDGGARDMVENANIALLNYVHAEKPGIAAARNVGLDWAIAHDVIVFIDDDERPTEGWLHHLLDTYDRFHPVAVAGPVISRFENEPEPWIIAGRFFGRRRLKTGTGVDLVATNNLLLDAAWLRESGIRFDERFGLSGGSDTLFARRIHKAGGKMIWCDEAVVFDVVPPHRSTRRWVMQRAFRSGNTWMHTSLELTSNRGAREFTRLQLTARGSVRMLSGAGRIALGIVTRRMDHRARGSRTLARGAGLVAGALGAVYAEYKRPF